MEENKKPEKKATSNTNKEKSKSKPPVEKSKEVKSIVNKIHALKAFQALKVHRYHKRFIQANYLLSDLRTKEEWRVEFKAQKIID